MLRTDIIQQLNEADNSGPGYAFPYFLPSYPVDVRLSAYRANRCWAIVVETLVFWIHGVEGHLACQTQVFCYGSDLSQAPGSIDPPLYLTGDGPSGALFDPQDITQLLINPAATDMTIRSKVMPITTNPAQYMAAGIDLKLLSDSTETWARYTAAGYRLGRSPRIFGYELLRLIAPTYRRLFFATEAEIVQWIGEPMPLLLRLDEWRHPDRDKGETPADSESFQMIADMIAHNDPTLYQPTEPPNTHWSNWPTAGMM